MSEKSEVQKKRERLEAMKAEREAKKAARPTAAPAAAAPAPPPANPAPTTETPGGTTASSPPDATTGGSVGTDSGVQQPRSNLAQNITRVSNVGAVNFQPPKVEKYEKELMTDQVYISTEPIIQGAKGSGERGDDNASFVLAQAQAAAKESEARAVRDAARRALFPVRSTKTNKDFENSTGSSDFAEFATKGTFVIQKSLLVGVDMSLEGAMGMGSGDGAGRGSQLATKQSTFVTEAVAGKVIGSISCQRGGNEYFAVAYTTPSDVDAGSAGGAMKGKVLVWSVKQPHVPAMEFATTSEVSCVTYSPFHPHLVIAGCADGRVVIWDIRKGSKPVEASFPSYEGHNGSAIVQAAVVGKQNHNQLVTVAANGHVCLWDVDSPTFPSTYFDVQTGPVGPLAKVLSTSAAGIPASGLTRFYVGSTDGLLYKGLRAGSSSSGVAEAKPIDTSVGGSGSHGGAGGATGGAETRASHVSTVTSMDCHPKNSKLILSSSIDSTCRLSYDRSGEGGTSGGQEGGGGGVISSSSTAAPTLEAKEERSSSIAIENFSDFVYAAKWSPTHPGVFAAVDGSGTLSFWNITVSMTTPVSTSKLGGDASNSSTALSALAWTSDGSHVVVGTCDGKAHLVSASAELTKPSSGDISGFSDFVTKTFGLTSSASSVGGAATAGAEEVEESTTA